MSIHPGLSWSAYRESLNQKGLGAVRSTEARVHDVGGLPDRYEKRTDAIWDETVQALRPEQRRALEFAALLPEDTVLTLWLCRLLEHDDVELPTNPGYESDPARPVVDELVRLRLLRPVEQAADTFALHRLLRARLLERLAEDPSLQDRLWTSIVALAELRGRESHQHITNPSLRAELSPLLALSRALFDNGRMIPAGSLANWIFSPLFALARFGEAETSLTRFVIDNRCTIEKDDPSEGATLLSNLAQLLKATNRLADAEPLIRRALDIDEKAHGPNHPNVATALNNLAQLLKATNRLADAEPLMRRVVEIFETSYGNNHPNVATALNNLAQLLQATNRLAEAEPLMRRALDIDEKAYGPNHPEVARDLNNLAALLQDTNRLAEAEPLMRRALDIDEKAYGPNHPEVATDVNNLAALLQATNRLADAEPLMRRALDIDEKAYGPHHPNVATDLNNLAALLQATN
ncbi:MAG: tetratricopeptide repeat protein, partial [Phycisphaerales bacterium]|nr:tetratricopeptide repeat protein [Phycisphaerales bacterium]